MFLNYNRNLGIKYIITFMYLYYVHMLAHIGFVFIYYYIPFGMFFCSSSEELT